MKILVFLGSVRDGRQAEKVGKFVTKKLEGSGHDVEIIDPLALDLPLLKQPIHFIPDQSQVSPKLKELNLKIIDADAYVMVTAEYNRNIPPALTNLIDYFPPSSFGFKTSAIVTYSMGHGGASVNVVLRSFLVELGAAPIPYVLQIQQVQNELDDDGNTKNGDRLTKNVASMLKQLEWYGSALRNHRQTFGAPKWGPVLSM